MADYYFVKYYRGGKNACDNPFGRHCDKEYWRLGSKTMQQISDYFNGNVPRGQLRIEYDYPSQKIINIIKYDKSI